MDGESLRELRYRERERKPIENARRQALLEIQEQREALEQARAEARARQEELDSKKEYREVYPLISHNREMIHREHIDPQSQTRISLISLVNCTHKMIVC